MNSQLEAIQLMLNDIGHVDESLMHRAAFHGCTRELVDLREELRQYLSQRLHRVQTRTSG